VGLLEPTPVHGIPWNTARFLDRGTLLRLGAQNGRCTFRAGLYAPAVLPGVERWSPTVESIGRRLAPRLGAFQVLAIQLPSTGSDGVTEAART
jgi:hypothetical protein